MFNIKITRFRMEISISSLYLIPHNIVLIAFPPSPPLRVYQPNWPFFWKSRAYTVFDLGISAPLIPAPNKIFLPPLLNP